MAESQPQAAFSALAKSLQFEWSYLQCILPNFDDEYVPIQGAVNQMFWPAVFAGTISNQEHHLLTLPARMGMGVRKPVETSKVAFATSRAGTSNITDDIKGCKQFSTYPITPSKCLKQHQLCTRFFRQNDENKLTSVLATLDPNNKMGHNQISCIKSSS